MYQSFEVEHEFCGRGFAMKISSTGGGFRHMTVLAAAGTSNLALMAGPAHAQMVVSAAKREPTQI
jgi:hypothetical protein